MPVNGLYALGREKFAKAEIDWLTDDIRSVMVDEADYTVDLEAHEFLSDIPLSGRVSMSLALTSKTVTGGWLGASLISFPAITGDVSEALAFIKYTGDPATSPLIGYRNSGVTNLPYTPNGSTVSVIVESEAFFRL